MAVPARTLGSWSFAYGSVEAPYADKHSMGEPDCEAVAHALNLLLAMDVAVTCSPATRCGGRYVFAVGLLSKSPLERADAAAETLFRSLGFDTRFETLAPTSAEALAAMERLARVNTKTTRYTACELRPHHAEGSVDQAFEGLVGLSEVRRTIGAIVNTIGIFGRGALSSAHLVLEGNPGCGKSEVARRFGMALGWAGATNGRTVFADASDLVSEYVGETPTRVRGVFDRARGGVLVVDECYRLGAIGGDVHSASHAHEALDAINELMEERRADTTVVFAGYPAETEALLDENPGLRGRFGMKLLLPDYTPEELARIVRAMADARSFAIDTGDELLAAAARSLARRCGFANARTMRTLLDRAILEHVQAGAVARTLDERDVRAALARMEKEGASPTREVGFTRAT